MSEVSLDTKERNRKWEIQHGGSQHDEYVVASGWASAMCNSDIRWNLALSALWYLKCLTTKMVDFIQPTWTHSMRIQPLANQALLPFTDDKLVKLPS